MMINSLANLKYNTPDPIYQKCQVPLNISVQNKPKQREWKSAAPTPYFSREAVWVYC